jgi:hypothetical protein
VHDAVELASKVGTWTDSPTSYSRQWVRCDVDGTSNCTDIAGKTGRHYTPTGSDVGLTLRIRVVAHGTVGDSAPATSAPTGVVT